MKTEEKVLIEMSKKDCGYLKDDAEGHIQDIEEALTEIPDPLLVRLYQNNLTYWKRILVSLEKSWEVEP